MNVIFLESISDIWPIGHVGGFWRTIWWFDWITQARDRPVSDVAKLLGLIVAHCIIC